MSLSNLQAFLASISLVVFALFCYLQLLFMLYEMIYLPELYEDRCRLCFYAVASLLGSFPKDFGFLIAP